MTNLALWIIWLLFLLITVQLFSQNILLSPQFGFIAGFIPQAILAVFYRKMWNLDLSTLTMAVLFCGTATFVIVSIITQRQLIKGNAKSGYYVKNCTKFSADHRNNKIIVEKWKLFLFIIFQALVLIGLVNYLSHFGNETLAENIGQYRVTGEEELDIALPAILSYARSFSISSGYIWAYLIVHSKIYKYKQHGILLVINIILSLLCSVVLGGRSWVITLGVATAMQIYLIHGKKYGWKKIKVRNIIIAIIITLLIISVFQSSLIFLGRNSSTGFMEYIAIYLSAELKNLDIFIREGVFGSDITTCYTIANTVSAIGKILHIPGWIHSWYNPYRSINGHSLGNVATTFYAPMHDGGILCVIFYMALMAILCQVMQKKAINSNINGKISFSVIFYSYAYFSVLFSFFSNKFYEIVASFGIIKTLISWCIIIYFIQSVKFRKR